MKTYTAKIVDTFVTEIIVGDCEWANENIGGLWVDCTDDGELTIAIGYVYDAKTQSFNLPPPPQPIG